MLQLIILVLASTLNILLGLFVLLKDSRNAVNRSFMFLTLMIALWSVANYFSVYDQNPATQLYSVRSVLFTAALLNLAVFLTFDTFPRAHFHRKKSTYTWLTLVTLFVAGLTLTPLVFSRLDGTGVDASPVPGVAIPIFAVHTVALLGTSIFNLFKKYKHGSSTQKHQLKSVLFGLITTFSLIVVTNFFAVIFLGSAALIPLAPLYALILSVSLAYAIIRHRFLDIRFIVARSVAYALLVGSMAFIYALALFGVSRAAFFSNLGEIAQQSIYIFLAVFMALTFQPFKNFFDKTTNKIFFRDSYDSEDLLRKLGKVLSQQINLETIMRSSIDLLSNNMKLEYARIVVFDEDGHIYKEDSTGGAPIKFPHDKELEILESKLITNGYDISRGKKSALLHKYDIGLAIKLETVDEVIGFIFLGAKESGSSYNSHDLKFLEITSKQMSIAVQNARFFNEIAEFNETLQQKIKHATAKLEKTNEKLKELDSAKDEFISMASHQLRTPLTTIKGYLSMVLEGDAGKLNKEQQQFIDQAFGSSQRMVYLIADLLNVSRLNTGKFVIDPVETNLADVVQQEVDQLQRHAMTRNMELTYKKPAKFPIVMLDETKTRQVIMNFTDNALYYTPAGGKVKVEIKETPTAIEFTVTDNGIGVPKELQHKLFSKFYRADNAKQARPDGTGLGLFMAKKVIIAQGGAVIFKSKVGVGSTFGFSFPKKKILVKK